MFYLLENNRIIDTNKALHNVDEIIIEENENEKYLYLVGWLGKHFCGKIKDKSNNIFNLVKCCQDLIETEEGQFYKPLKLQIDSFVVKYDCCVLFKGIKAIYKPDGKGNYIKVWEREEEDENDK